MGEAVEQFRKPVVHEEKTERKSSLQSDIQGKSLRPLIWPKLALNGSSNTTKEGRDPIPIVSGRRRRQGRSLEGSGENEQEMSKTREKLVEAARTRYRRAHKSN